MVRYAADARVSYIVDAALFLLMRITAVIVFQQSMHCYSKQQKLRRN